MTLSAERDLRNIESGQNPRIKELRASLKQNDRAQLAIEGDHLLKEAVRSGLRVRTIFVRSGDERLLPSPMPRGAEVLRLSAKVFSSAVSTEHPQGIAAIVDRPEFRFEHMLRGTPLVILAGALQDPGNLGTLARSAEAFGATGLILLPGTVSLWNGKALRASSGSAFRLPVLAMTAEEAFAILRAHGIPVSAAVARDGGPPENLVGPTALLLGNEGTGLPEPWLASVDRRITIPCPGAVESLNAAVAGSVLLYEAARQRQLSSRRPHGDRA